MRPLDKWKRTAGVLLSLVCLAGVWLMPAPAGLPVAGQRMLAVTLFAVIWWTFGVVAPAYTALLLCLAYVALGLAGPDVVFRLWITPNMWLMVGAFLMAAAVTKSGLARRIAYYVLARFAGSYLSLTALVYLLGLVLSFVIPQPFPRTLLIMAAVAALLDGSGISGPDAAAVGFATFAGATATSTILLTGDSLLNAAAVGFSGVKLSWLGWLGYMGIPGLFASLLMWGLHLLVFRPSAGFRLDRAALRGGLAELGPMTPAERRTLAWVAAALVLWATDSLHHIDPAWVALGAAVGLGLPKVGEVLEPEDIGAGVNWPILLFVTGALAIGAVSRETGLAQWIAHALLPAVPPANPYAFALLIGVVTMAVHMLLGSALATMSIVAPPVVAYAASIGWSGLFPALLVYTAVAIHFLLPFHQVTVLLGVGPTGRYSGRETLRYGVPLTLIVLLVLLLEVAWWQVTGLIPR